MVYNYTHTDVPTIFEIAIRELGWIYNVYLEVDGTHIPAEWIGYSNHCEKESSEIVRYSLFRATHTFWDIGYNKTATFHYFIDGKEYVCTTPPFDVYY